MGPRRAGLSAVEVSGTLILSGALMLTMLTLGSLSEDCDKPNAFYIKDIGKLEVFRRKRGKSFSGDAQVFAPSRDLSLLPSSPDVKYLVACASTGSPRRWCTKSLCSPLQLPAPTHQPLPTDQLVHSLPRTPPPSAAEVAHPHHWSSIIAFRLDGRSHHAPSARLLATAPSLLLTAWYVAL